MGAMQVAMLHRDPAYELVGVVAHSDEKHGKDAGEAVGIGPIGVTITSDIDEALAIDAQCVLINGNSLQPDLLDRILRSGKNVVTISGAYDLDGEPFQDQLEAAALAGGATLTGGGNMPGLLQDVLPLFMSGYTTDVRQIWARERNCHDWYASYGTMSAFYGNPMPSDEEVKARIGSTVPQGIHRQAANLCAKAFGLALSDFKLTNYEVVAAPHDITMPGTGVYIAKGTVAGSRFEYTGFVDGEPWHVLEMEFTAELGLGPQWKQNLDLPEFDVRVDGDPPLQVTWGCGGIVNLIRLNAARMVNLVEPVIAAAPGCRTILELPAGGAGVLTTRAIVR
jgi:2,4-diaminopentanoate dehydrogenase